MTSKHSEFLGKIEGWLRTESTIHAAVLYGSTARKPGELAAADSWSDIDIHIITSSPGRFELLDWNQAIRDAGYCLSVMRPAAGGVRKARVLFTSGELELVILPLGKLRFARILVEAKLHKRIPFIQNGLSVLATGLSSGYRFLKGEKAWGEFYAQVARDFPLVRINEEEIRNLAYISICDMLTGLQRLHRGEHIAAQRILHRTLAETNFLLIRELRLRRGQPVPSFEPARRIEALLSPQEQLWVRVNARLEKEELRQAMWRSFDGLTMLMRELIPDWKMPPGVDLLLAPYSISVE